jgi:hypothetical protein
MREKKAWAIKNRRGALVWRETVEFTEPDRTALFRTKRHAEDYINRMRLVYGPIYDNCEPIKVNFIIKEEV